MVSYSAAFNCGGWIARHKVGFVGAFWERRKKKKRKKKKYGTGNSQRRTVAANWPGKTHFLFVDLPLLIAEFAILSRVWSSSYTHTHTRTRDMRSVRWFQSFLEDIFTKYQRGIRMAAIDKHSTKYIGRWVHIFTSTTDRVWLYSFFLNCIYSDFDR